MKRKGLVVLLMVVVGLLNGCNSAHDRQLPNGTKYFGERTLKDGTKTVLRVELPNGVKQFDVTVLPDGSKKIGRVEEPDGTKYFDMTVLPNGTAEKSGRVEFPNGEKHFDVTFLPDGTQKYGRGEAPDGAKHFDVTLLPNGTQKYGRVEAPNGEKHFDVTLLPDGSNKIGRVEYTDGRKQFDVTVLPDGTQRSGRVEEPNETKQIAPQVVTKGYYAFDGIRLGMTAYEAKQAMLILYAEQQIACEDNHCGAWYTVARMPIRGYRGDPLNGPYVTFSWDKISHRVYQIHASDGINPFSLYSYNLQRDYGEPNRVGDGGYRLEWWTPNKEERMEIWQHQGKFYLDIQDKDIGKHQ